VSEPNDYDQQDEAAFAALYPDSMALRVVRRRQFDITGEHGPYPNRRDPGQRIYLTVHVESRPAGDAL
jgi:hypothetical protein